MRKDKLVKKLEALTLCTAMIFSLGTGTKDTTVTKAASQSEDAKMTYIVRAEDKNTRKELEHQYDVGDTISELSNDSMGKENFTTLELTGKEAAKLEKNDSVELVEPDVVVKGLSMDRKKKVKKIQSRKADKTR